MAPGSPGSHPTFTEEIDFNELKFGEIVGRGAFGVVLRATWRGNDVAVKQIETETEKRAFVTELKQLSRVNHENIVRLYGASTKHPVCLVMEFAEGGSLYNVLHGAAMIRYTMAHAMSWCLQTAKGVSYLHNMKPKAIIHRDLKPPNLLLDARGIIIKICDFGTACDFQTHMTNNKGSAAWMAPEVFEGNVYSEKCDVFSYGIVLWECLSRQKPFDDIGGPAFRIMWAVHSGTRPPMMRKTPKPLEKLMARCWSKNIVERPSMTEVVRIMSMMMPLYKGADQPLFYPKRRQSAIVDDDHDSGTSSGEGPRALTQMNADNIVVLPTLDITPPVTVTEEDRRSIPGRPHSSGDYSPRFPGQSPRNSFLQGGSQQSRVSLEGGGLPILTEDQQTTTSPKPIRRYGHRRVGSHGNPPAAINLADCEMAASLPPHRTSLGTPHSADYMSHHEVQASLRCLPHSQSWIQESSTRSRPISSGSDSTPPIFPELDDSLRPLPPIPDSQSSTMMYYDHVTLAEEYIRVSREVHNARARIQEIKEKLREEKMLKMKHGQMIKEFQELAEENDELSKLDRQLKQQLTQLDLQPR